MGRFNQGAAIRLLAVITAGVAILAMAVGLIYLIRSSNSSNTETIQLGDGTTVTRPKFPGQLDQTTIDARKSALDLIPAAGANASTSVRPSAPISSAISIAPSLAPVSISAGMPARGTADAMQIAMHPSLAPRPGNSQISIDSTQPSDTPQQKIYDEAVRLEKARLFVMSMCTDLQGNLWVGTEDGGVQRFNSSAPKFQQWTQFTAKDGLGDDNGYGIACDKQGRIWVGHLNHGVSVYNGQKWQNYEVVGGLTTPTSLSGPLGERVFHITVCPTDGDVWIATNCGLSRYSISKDDWTYFTRADGLPSDQANSIAFDADGNIYVATQCDGIAMADAKDNYKTWRQVTGPDDEPTVPTGDGLPSNLMNDILVAKDGTVYAATDAGLAWSKDHGTTWKFVRGADWADKVRRSDTGPPDGWKETSGAVLAEDYCTCVSEDSESVLVGHRVQASDIFSQPSSSHPTGPSALINAFLSSSRVGTFLGTYGNGADHLSGAAKPAVPAPISVSQQPAMPAAAALIALQDLANGINAVTLHRRSPDFGLGPVAALDDDWTTQGNWIDRYGQFAAILCAQGGGGNDLGGGYRAAYFNYTADIGHAGNDKLRYWVGSLQSSDPRNPQCWLLGGRRQAEWDDHGEAFPRAMDGPDIYCTLKLPAGQYFVSLYFCNNDGESGSNRLRDFSVQARPVEMNDQDFQTLGTGDNLIDARYSAAKGGARERVSSFYGGVYKRFFVDIELQQDAKFGYVAFHVRRNHSVNSTLSGVFIDPVGDLCGPQGPDVQPAISPLTRDDVNTTSGLGATLQDALDQYLYFRNFKPLSFAIHSREFGIPILRRLFDSSNGLDNCVAAELLRTNRYAYFRSDLATCLSDEHIFNLRDRIFHADINTRFFSGKWAETTAKLHSTTTQGYDTAAYQMSLPLLWESSK